MCPVNYVQERPLSEAAKKVIALMEEVRTHPETEKHLHKDDHGVNWLSMYNISNGHREASPEYKQLMDRLCVCLDEELIHEGQHSKVYYELKRAGFSLRTGESDSFGPLSAVFKYGDWQVCYG